MSPSKASTTSQSAEQDLYFGHKDICDHVTRTVISLFPDPSPFSPSRSTASRYFDAVGNDSGYGSTGSSNCSASSSTTTLYEVPTAEPEADISDLGEWLAYVLYRTALPNSYVLHALHLLRRVARLPSSDSLTYSLFHPSNPRSSPSDVASFSSSKESLSTSCDYDDDASVYEDDEDMYPYEAGTGDFSARSSFSIPSVTNPRWRHALLLTALQLATAYAMDDSFALKSWCIAGKDIFTLREVTDMGMDFFRALGWQMRATIVSEVDGRESLEDLALILAEDEAEWMDQMEGAKREERRRQKAQEEERQCGRAKRLGKKLGSLFFSAYQDQDQCRDTVQLSHQPQVPAYPASSRSFSARERLALSASKTYYTGPMGSFRVDALVA